MDWYNKLLALDKVKEALMDEESKILFAARINFFCTRNEEKFLNTIRSISKKWECQELLEYYSNNQEVIIFGCGNDGKKQKEILDLCKIPLAYWCDNNQDYKGKTIENVLVLSVDEVVKNHRESLVILGSRRYAKEMYDELLEKDFPKEKILWSRYGILVANCGNQYFDLFEPQEEEIYIDAGTYNGDTILGFLAWANGKRNKIFAMEPLEEMIEVIKQRIDKNKIENVTIYNNAAWNRKEELHFLDEQAGSSINDNGSRIVSGIDIDTLVREEKVTFIKMDIEGAELKALEGAKRTIVKNKPRLAICIYHKPEDVILIAEYILNLNPSYKLYIRHYASNMWETVLYALP